jgi:predicted HicB family RNase H-like nuclease
MAKRTPPAVTPDTPIGHDVDIDRETRRDKQGRRVTEAYVDRLVGASRRPGRPALAEGPSPSIAFRVPAALREQAEQIAEREGKTVSQLAREALEARIAAS